ncbi:hypothetical protein [Streptomyces sp. NPDC002779]
MSVDVGAGVVGRGIRWPGVALRGPRAYGQGVMMRGAAGRDAG